MINNSKWRWKARGDYRRNKYTVNQLEKNKETQSLSSPSSYDAQKQLLLGAGLPPVVESKGLWASRISRVCSQDLAKATHLKSRHLCTALLHLRSSLILFLP